MSYRGSHTAVVCAECLGQKCVQKVVVLNWDLSRCRLKADWILGGFATLLQTTYFYGYQCTFLAFLVPITSRDYVRSATDHMTSSHDPHLKCKFRLTTCTFSLSPFSMSEGNRNLPPLQSDNHICSMFWRWSPQSWPHTRTSEPGLPDTIAARERYVSFVLYYQAMWEFLPKTVHMIYALLHSAVTYKII